MKVDSKILGVLFALLAVAIVISAASAVDLTDEFNNGNFKLNTVSGSDFNQTVNIATDNMDLLIFENSKGNSSDAYSIIYFKDSSSDKNQITSFVKNLESAGKKVEETDKYVVFKNDVQNSNVDVGNSLDGIFDFANDIISFDGDMNFSADSNSISLSNDGLKVNDANGDNVSITSEGVKISSNSSSGAESVNVSADVDAVSNIANSDYSIYMKNNDNEVIVLSGNDLELLKAMAETTTFNGN